MAKKMKGFLTFKLSNQGNAQRTFNVHGDGFEDSNDVKVVSVLRDENGLPTGDFVVWDGAKAQKKANGKQLEISSAKLLKKHCDLFPSANKSGDRSGDLIGDLTVTVEIPGEIFSLSMASVVYVE